MKWRRIVLGRLTPAGAVLIAALVAPPRAEAQVPGGWCGTPVTGIGAPPFGGGPPPCGTPLGGGSSGTGAGSPFDYGGQGIPGGDSGGASCPAPCTGSPCYVGSGAYENAFTDLVLRTVGSPLVVRRVYQSYRYVDGPFGFGWTSNLTPRLYETTYLFAAPSTYQKEAVVTMPNGVAYRFAESAGGIFTAPPGRYDTLVRNVTDGTYDLTLRNTRTRLHFASDGTWLSQTDEYGNTLTATYAAGKLQTLADSAGSARSLTVSWGPNGRISAIQDSAGRLLRYTYTAQGGLDTVTDPTGHVARYSYVTGRFGPLLSQIKDHWNRVISIITYDTRGRVQSYTEDGETYTYSYAYQGNPVVTAKTDSVNNRTLFTFAAGGVITDITPPAGGGGAQRNEIDSAGVVQVAVDGAGVRTRYQYDSFGRILSVTRDELGPLAVRYDYAYDPNFPHRVTSITPKDPATGSVNLDWQAWRYDYYQAGLPAPGALFHVYRVRDNGTTLATLATYVYDSHGRVTRYTSATGGVTDYGYDAVGNLTTVTAPANNDAGTRPVTTYGYDSAGRVASVEDALNHTTSYVYDGLDRVTSVTLPKPAVGSTLNFTTTYSYDNFETPSGLAFTNVADPNGLTTKQGYDQFGHLVKAIDALAKATTYAYTRGLLTSITDANNNTTAFDYNAGRRLWYTTFPDGLRETYTYTGEGLLQQKTDRRNQILTYGYDHLKRLIQKTYPNSSTVIYTYDGQKRMQVVDTSVSPTETHLFSYDTSYRLASTTQASRGTLNYQYNPDDSILSLAIQAGTTSTYAYYSDGSLNTIVWSATAGQFKYSYTLTGQPASLTFPNGQRRDWSYDDQGRLALIGNSAAAADVATYSYGYDFNYTTGTNDRLGQRVSMTATVPSQGLTSALSKYEYDPLYQLTKVTNPAVAPFNGEVDTWAYDAIGNRTVATAGAATSNYTYQKIGTNPNNWQRLLNDGAFAYSYDSNGNTATKTGASSYTYKWNPDDRLTAITGSLTASYVYDYQGLRSSRTVSGATSTYLYDGLNLVYENAASPGYYLFGPGIDEPLAVKRNGVVHYFAVDGLGSVTGITSAAGTVENTYLYGAWGGMWSQTGSLANAFGYTAREFAEAGSWFYRARYYSSSTGRFLSEDDPKRQSGPSKYAYVDNAPVGYADPTGLAILRCWRPLRWPLTLLPLVLPAPLSLPVPGNNWCPLHEYVYNTDIPDSQGFDPKENRPETGKDHCQVIPEPIGMCVWNTFEQASGPRDGYNFVTNNCHNAVNRAVQRCTPCASAPASPPLPPWFNDRR